MPDQWLDLTEPSDLLAWCLEVSDEQNLDLVSLRVHQTWRTQPCTLEEETVGRGDLVQAQYVFRDENEPENGEWIVATPLEFIKSGEVGRPGSGVQCFFIRHVGPRITK